MYIPDGFARVAPYLFADDAGAYMDHSSPRSAALKRAERFAMTASLLMGRSASAMLRS
ncbi:hypothetical protein ACFOOP_00360 [Marinicaulis aureus]|uniref:hypothetical protein n=1 Tax=Hyphococcus aureus TaxID=2666033 RepID=UPI00360AF892